MLAACSSPAADTTGPTRVSTGVDASTESSSGAPRTLRVASLRESITVYGGTSSDARELGDLFNSGLTYFDAAGSLLPKLAVKVPSVADGDWRTSADGSMEVTWKLKPGLTWQDGAPLTSEDIAFTVRMFKDPAGSLVVPRGIGFVSEVLAPDPETAVLRYPRLFNGAAVAGLPEFPLVPRHRLADEYARVGAEGLANHPFWTTEYVGAGPYRMTSRTLGSEIAALAFDQYVFGRPRIDRIIVRFMPDVNAIVASLLAGEIDMTLVGTLDPHDAAPLKQQWEAAGRGTVGIVPVRVRQMQMQYRDPALPWATDVRVRQAMLHLIDRQGLVESVHEGLSPMAEVALPRSSPAYSLLEARGIPTFGFDRAQAERLLAAAGWTRGADGVRRNAAGVAFTFNPAIVGAEDTDEVLVIVDGMKAAGINSEPNVIDNAAVDVNEQRAKGHSIARTAAADDTYWDRFLSGQAASPENRWRGANTGGYSNPTFDRLVGQWVTAMDPPTRNEREADLHKLLIDDLVYLPLFFDPEIYAFRQGVVGPKSFSPQARNTTGDVHVWTVN